MATRGVPAISLGREVAAAVAVDMVRDVAVNTNWGASTHLLMLLYPCELPN